MRTNFTKTAAGILAAVLFLSAPSAADARWQGGNGGKSASQAGSAGKGLHGRRGGPHARGSGSSSYPCWECSHGKVQHLGPTPESLRGGIDPRVYDYRGPNVDHKRALCIPLPKADQWDCVNSN